MLWPCTGREGEGWGGGGAAEAGDERWRVGEQEMVEKTKETRERESAGAVHVLLLFVQR